MTTYSNRFTSDEMLRLLRDMLSREDPPLTPSQWNRTARYRGAGRRRSAPHSSTIIARFGSWEQAMAAALQLPAIAPRSHRFTNEQLIAHMRRFGTWLEPGRNPSTIQWKRFNSTLHESERITDTTYLNRFGSWRQAVVAGGLEPTRRPVEFSRATMIERLRDWSEQHDGATPSSDAWTRAQRQLAHADQIFIRRFMNEFGSWGAALRAAGFEPMKTYAYRAQTWTPDEMLEEIRRWAGDRPPPHTSMAWIRWQRSGVVQPRLDSRAIIAQFGSWDGAIKAAGLGPVRRKPLVELSQEEMLDAIRAWSSEHTPGFGPTADRWLAHLRTLPPPQRIGVDQYLAKFGTWSAAITAAGLDMAPRSVPSRGPGQLKALLGDWAAVHDFAGLGPTIEQWKAWRRDEPGRKLPGAAMFWRTFGSWNAALMAAGLTPPRATPRASQPKRT